MKSVTMGKKARVLLWSCGEATCDWQGPFDLPLTQHIAGTNAAKGTTDRHENREILRSWWPWRITTLSFLRLLPEYGAVSLTLESKKCFSVYLSWLRGDGMLCYFLRSIWTGFWLGGGCAACDRV